MCAAEVKPAYHWFHVPLQSIGIFFCVYFYFHLPKSGKALLLLGGIVAVMMLMDMRPVHKGIYVLIVIGLILIENRALDKERTDSAKEQNDRRMEENDRFRSIADGLAGAIQQGEKQFDTTIARIETTLKTSEETLKNTLPIAALEFQSMSVYAPSLPIAVGHQLEFNVSFTNIGNDMARNYDHETRLYVRRLDDLEAQREIASDFNQSWGMSQRSKGAAIRPNYPAFFSFKSLPLKEDEVNGVLDHSLTLYVLIRFTWTDRTGRWASDECFAFQDPMHDLVAGHPCAIFTQHRYKVMQH